MTFVVVQAVIFVLLYLAFRPARRGRPQTRRAEGGRARAGRRAFEATDDAGWDW